MKMTVTATSKTVMEIFEMVDFVDILNITYFWERSDAPNQKNFIRAIIQINRHSNNYIFVRFMAKNKWQTVQKLKNKRLKPLYIVAQPQK